jgi:excisionase family DNA binding protein
MGEFLTTKEIAEKLSVSVRRVRQYIENNQLKAEKIGRDYMVRENELKNIKINEKAGRPKKEISKK